MSATDPEDILSRHYAREIRPGWHVHLDGQWWLVDNADPYWGRIILTVRTHSGAVRTEHTQLRRSDTVDARTPEEQIAYTEAQRLAQIPGMGLGPVGRVHFDEQLDRALGAGYQKEWRR